MDKDGKVRLVDVFSFGTEEVKEEVSNNNIEEILEKNIEESNKLHENKYISDYNKNNQLTKKDIQSEKIIEEPDLVEQLLENQNNKIDERNKKEMAKNIVNQNKKINKKPLKFPKDFQNNPTPFDFIDFMEKKYNKFLLDQDRDTYFSLEKVEKEGKFKEVKCWKFTQKNSIMNHVLKKVNNNYKKTKTKITCIVANNDLIYIGDDNGIIRIFSLNSEMQLYNDS